MPEKFRCDSCLWKEMVECCDEEEEENSEEEWCYMWARKPSEEMIRTCIKYQRNGREG